MANNLNNIYQEMWSRDVQDYFNKSLVSFGLAGFNFVEKGKDKYHRPVLDDVYAQTYTTWVKLQSQSVGSMDEYIQANIVNAVPLFVEDVDQLNTSYSVYGKLAPQAAEALRNEIDANFFLEAANNVTNISRLITKADLAAGGSGTIALSSSNVLEALAVSKYALYENNVSDTVPFAAALSPRASLLVEIALSGTGNNVGDTTLRNGYTRTIPTLGMDIYMSNNIKHTYAITKAFVATDTITINGVELTASTSPAAAGEFKLAKFKDILAGTGNAGTDYIDISHKDRAKLRKYKVTASGSAGSTSTIITSSGRVTISTSGTGTIGNPTVISPVMQRGAVDLVVQQNVDTRFQEGTNQGQIGTHMIAWTKYGVKKFADGATKTVLLQLDR